MLYTLLLLVDFRITSNYLSAIEQYQIFQDSRKIKTVDSKVFVHHREALDAKMGENVELEAAKAEVAGELAQAQSSIAELAAEKQGLESSLATVRASLQSCEDKLVSAEVGACNIMRKQPCLNVPCHCMPSHRSDVRQGVVSSSKAETKDRSSGHANARRLSDCTNVTLEPLQTTSCGTNSCLRKRTVVKTDPPRT